MAGQRRCSSVPRQRVVVARSLARRLTAGSRIAGLGAVTYLVVAMVTVNVWEDIASAIFIWTIVGAALATTPRSPERE